jgi:putative beta barrel porin BBP7
MNMRWAWTLPVLSSLAVTVVTSSSQAQGPLPQGYGNDPTAQQFAGPMPPSAPYAQYQPGYPQMAAMPVMMPQFAQPQPGQQAPQGPALGPPPMMMMAPPGLAPPGLAGPGMPPMGMMPPGMSPYGVDPAAFAGGPMPSGMPPGYGGPMMGPAPDAFGSYGSMPTEMPEDMQGEGGTGCPYCGGRGCDACKHLRHGHHGEGGLLGNLCGCCGPYPDGGCGAIRWYDFAIDFMMLKRDNTGNNLVTTTLGIGGTPVLQTNQLNFNYEPSFRFSGVIQAGPGSNIEFTYFGLFQYSDRAFVRRTGFNDLFSVYSRFGTVPIFGFPETDESDFQQIVYQSTFDSFEVNFRQRWMAANCRYQGSWLIGARHFILDEKFRYSTSSSLNGVDPLDPTIPDPLNPAQSRTDVDTTNNLTGMQIGGDIWICVLPGLRLGGEAKAGVYGNHSNINTTIGVNTGASTFREQLNADNAAFIYEADLLGTWRLNDQWTLRAGYQFLFVDQVALAPENFNTVPPFGPLVRTPLIDHSGSVFYHGWNAGFEFMW